MNQFNRRAARRSNFSFMPIRQKNVARDRVYRIMLGEAERKEIARLWERKLRQDELELPLAERHRNLEPSSAEFIGALAAAGRQALAGSWRLKRRLHHCPGRRGSTHLRTRHFHREGTEAPGRVRETIARLGLTPYVEFLLEDAASALKHVGRFDFVFIDCEKDDYSRFSICFTLHPAAWWLRTTLFRTRFAATLLMCVPVLGFNRSRCPSARART